MAGTAIGDMGDFLKTFPQYTERDYMFKLSLAKIAFMSVDSTHIKYLSDKDKKRQEKRYNMQKTYNAFANFLTKEKSKAKEIVTINE